LSTRTRKTKPTLVCQTGGRRLCAKGYVRQNQRREKNTMTTHTHKRCATSPIVLPTPKAFVLHRSRAAPRVCIFRACDVGRELTPAPPPDTMSHPRRGAVVLLPSILLSVAHDFFVHSYYFRREGTAARRPSSTRPNNARRGHQYSDCARARALPQHVTGVGEGAALSTRDDTNTVVQTSRHPRALELQKSAKKKKTFLEKMMIAAEMMRYHTPHPAALYSSIRYERDYLTNFYPSGAEVFFLLDRNYRRGVVLQKEKKTNTHTHTSKF